MDLLVADGRVLTLTPDGAPDDPDASLFWATVGGIGLTGIILRATLAMTRTETAWFLADGVVTKSLDETIAVHSDGSESRYDYSVGLVRRHLGAPRSSAAPRSAAATWRPWPSCGSTHPSSPPTRSASPARLF